MNESPEIIVMGDTDPQDAWRRFSRWIDANPDEEFVSAAADPEPSLILTTASGRQLRFATLGTLRTPPSSVALDNFDHQSTRAAIAMLGAMGMVDVAAQVIYSVDLRPKGVRSSLDDLIEVRASLWGSDSLEFIARPKPAGKKRRFALFGR